MAPIIPWIGGKRRLVDLLLSRFPPHSCYVEVFAGGAAVFFARNPADVEVLNDVNGDLVNLYRVVTHHLEEFVRQFKWAITSRQVFKWLQDTRPETLTDIQRAARFFYLQQQSFGGKVAGTATTAPAINLLRIEENLSAAHMRLASGTYIENLDWATCIDRYDRPHTLFYLDPPYWQTEGYGVPLPVGSVRGHGGQAAADQRQGGRFYQRPPGYPRVLRRVRHGGSQAGLHRWRRSQQG